MASGCNVIYFSTGNGSITNFPFVPTIKVISTTKRYTLMARDMDVDAGDATLTADERATRLFELTLRVASGARTLGEAAGHYQLQIWRDYSLTHHPAPPPAMRAPPGTSPAKGDAAETAASSKATGDAVTGADTDAAAPDHDQRHHCGYARCHEQDSG